MSTRPNDREDAARPLPAGASVPSYRRESDRGESPTHRGRRGEANLPSE